MKYYGKRWYMKRDHKSGLKANDMVEVDKQYKIEHRTYVDVRDANGNLIVGLSAKLLRRRPRH